MDTAQYYDSPVWQSYRASVVINIVVYIFASVNVWL